MGAVMDGREFREWLNMSEQLKNRRAMQQIKVSLLAVFISLIVTSLLKGGRFFY